MPSSTSPTIAECEQHLRAYLTTCAECDDLPQSLDIALTTLVTAARRADQLIEQYKPIITNTRIMRDYQREYFKNRTKTSLDRSKRFELIVDKLIADLNTPQPAVSHQAALLTPEP
jgi:hypothetical protein